MHYIYKQEVAKTGSIKYHVEMIKHACIIIIINSQSIVTTFPPSEIRGGRTMNVRSSLDESENESNDARVVVREVVGKG